MRNVIRFSLVALVSSMAAAACVESDEHLDDVDRDPSLVDGQQVDGQPVDGQPVDGQQETPQQSPDSPLSTPADVVVQVPAHTPDEQVGDDSQVRVQLLAGKQPNHPAAWLAHAVANESECGHTSCPYTVEVAVSEPEAIPPFESVDTAEDDLAEEDLEADSVCMLDGGVAIGDAQTYTASAEAGAAKARFVTEVSSGADFVELAMAGTAVAEVPAAGGVRADAGATLYADETALILDIVNPGGEPVELEVSWELVGDPERGEASWQGSLWYTDNPSRLAECYVAPDYQYDRVFDVFQDVDGSVRGEASGTARLPLSADEHSQVGLRLNVGAHAVGREGSSPELAQDSASQVAGTLRFRVATADDRR